MIRIPLQATPGQTMQILLGGQPCTLSVYQRASALYCDCRVGEAVAWRGRLCRNMVNLCSFAHESFSGALFFVDMEGFVDPHFSGLGSRWRLMYTGPDEALPAGVQGAA